MLLSAPALVAWAVLPALTPTALQDASDSAESDEAGQPGDQGGREPAAGEPTDQSGEDHEPGERADRYGDPLPDGAIMRLGTVRYRTAGMPYSSFAHRSVPLMFVPGRDMLLSRGRQGGVGFWDPASGKLFKELVPASGFAIHDFDVASDGKHIVTLARRFTRGSRESAVRVQTWDPATGEPLHELNLTELHNEPQSRAIKLTPDGESLAIGTSKGNVRIVDLATGKELLNVQIVQDEVSSLDFSPDGEWLAVASARGVAVWRWLEGMEPHLLLTHEQGGQGAMSVAFSPDGQWLATGTEGLGGIRVWNVQDRSLQWRIDRWSGAHYMPDQIAFSADSAALVIPVAEGGERLEIRDTRTGRLIRAHETRGVSMWYAAISADQQWIAGSGGGGGLRVWRLEDSEPQHDQFQGHGQPIQHLVFTPDGESLLAAPSQGEIALWDSAKGAPHWLRPRGVDSIARTTSLTHLTISPDGQYAAGVTYGDTMDVWDLETGEQRYKLPGHGRQRGFASNSIAFTPDSRRFASFGNDLHLRVWDTESGKALAEHDLRPHFAGLPISDDDQFGSWNAEQQALRRVDFSPDCRHLYVVYSNTLNAIDVASGELVKRRNVEQPDVLRFSPDGTSYALLEQQREGDQWGSVVTLWDPASSEASHEIKSPDLTVFGGIWFAPQGSFLAVSGVEYVGHRTSRFFLELYDTRSGERLGKAVFAYMPSVVAFSPDSRRVAIANGDTTIIIWDVQQIMEPSE
jgi:WD40 repeat protein